MKTWEMIKLLTENHNLNFKNVRCGGIVGYNEKGSLSWNRDIGENEKMFTIHCVKGNAEANGNWNDDWELIAQEVTWQEAIQAWLNNKSIRIEVADKEGNGKSLYYQKWTNRLGCMGVTEGFNKDLFVRGKWYIE